MVIRWVPLQAVIAAHEKQLAVHGGATGVRNQGMLESAIGRPENLAAYGEPDLAALAACYGFGIIKNHPFVDGNKRTGLVTLAAFLRLNGYRLIAPQPDAVRVILGVAAGDISEHELADWVRANMEVVTS